MIRIKRSESGSLIIYPPLNMHYQASDAMIRIGTPAVAMPEAGSEIAATVENISETISAISKRGDNSLTFASAINVFPERQYLLEKATGESAIIEVMIGGATITLSQGLPFDVAIGDTLKGISVAINLSSAQTAIAGSGLINAYATINSQRIDWQQDFKIVEVMPKLTLTWAKLTRDYPLAHSLRPRSDVQPKSLIDSAWEHDLKPDLLAKKINLEYIKSWDLLEPAHALCVMWRLTESSHPNDEERIKNARVRYWKRLETIVDNPDGWYSSPTSVGVADGLPIDMTTIYMTR